MKLRVLLLVLVAGLSQAGHLHAQHITSPYSYVETSQTLGAYMGYLNTNPGSQDLGPHSGKAYGGRYDIRVNGPLSIEANVELMPTTRVIHDTVFVGTSRRTLGTADMQLALADVGFKFSLTGPRTWNGIAPFVLFGGGVVFDAKGSSANAVSDALPADIRYKFGTSFAGLLGAGVEVYLTSKLGLRGDARASFWQVKAPSAFLIRNFTVPGSEWTQNALFSGSVAYHF